MASPRFGGIREDSSVEKKGGCQAVCHLTTREKGKQNVVADALSRKDEDVEALLCAISIIQPD